MTHIPDEAVKAAISGFNGSNGSYFKEHMKDAILAALPHLQLGYEVKKLEWVAGDGISAAKSYYEAKANGLTYCVIDGQCWIEGLGISIQKIGTDKEAKAAAQSDFERRVRECIVAKPVDVEAVRRQAFEEADKLVETSAYRSTVEGRSLVHCQFAKHDHHHGTIAAAIRALSVEPAQGEQDEPCGACGSLDCDFDCDGDYDAPTSEAGR